jgi:hypothetical protein
LEELRLEHVKIDQQAFDQLLALQKLSLSDCEITTSIFAGLHNLRELSLYDVKIDPKALADLARCVKLESFSGSSDGDDDASALAVAAALGELPNLKRVMFFGAGDASLAELCHSRSIEDLYLSSRSSLTPNGLTELQRLPLKNLNLGNFKNADGLFAALSPIRSLESLVIDVRTVDDDALADIEQMTNLKKLFFEVCSVGNPSAVTEDQINRLRKNLPAAEINDQALDRIQSDKQLAAQLKQLQVGLNAEDGGN